MRNIYINTLPPEGRDFVLDDPGIWSEPISEFHMDCRVTRPISAHVSVLPVEKGCLVRGQLSGEVVLPCDRCTEDAHVAVNTRFESFELLPGAQRDTGEEEDGSDGDMPSEDSHIRLEDSVPVLDLAALCWEEFSLALPVKPLCKPDCKGLCTVCGANLNTGKCTCAHGEGDPRLAILRNVKIKKSGN